MKILLKICLLSLAFIPIVLDPRVIYPSISGKIFLIQLVLVLESILFLIYYFKYKPKFPSFRNSLVISVCAFIIILATSTIFAGDKYIAFWGNMERVEGLTNTLFYFSFFFYNILIFDRKDWLWFFKLSLFTAIILLSRQFLEFHDGIIRPGSFTNNPTFLSGYLLFAIASALIVFWEKWWWKILSILVIISSVIGIFIAQTRGSILGFIFGTIVFLLYFSFKKKRVAIVILMSLVIASLLFAFTRQNEIWKKVPGLSRFATINTPNLDSGEQRLVMYRISLQSVNPIQNGLKVFLIGYGPENLPYAFYKYYDQTLEKYGDWFYDRSHNKFIDVLVMEGILGLISYLAIWFFYFKKALKYPPLIFFGVAILVHMMFAFDEITIFIPLFAIWAFASQNYD